VYELLHVHCRLARVVYQERDTTQSEREGKQINVWIHNKVIQYCQIHFCSTYMCSVEEIGVFYGNSKKKKKSRDINEKADGCLDYLLIISTEHFPD